MGSGRGGVVQWSSLGRTCRQHLWPPLAQGVVCAVGQALSARWARHAIVGNGVWRLSSVQHAGGRMVTEPGARSSVGGQDNSVDDGLLTTEKKRERERKKNESLFDACNSDMSNFI